MSKLSKQFQDNDKNGRNFKKLRFEYKQEYYRKISVQ